MPPLQDDAALWFHGSALDRQSRPLPFGERLRELRKARGLSIESLAYSIWDPNTGTSLSFGYVGMLERGLRRPSIETIELLSATLEVEPTEFPEYILAKARGLLDEQEVGLPQALRNLKDLPGELSKVLPAADKGEPAAGEAEPQD